MKPDLNPLKLICILCLGTDFLFMKIFIIQTSVQLMKECNLYRPIPVLDLNDRNNLVLILTL